MKNFNGKNLLGNKKRRDNYSSFSSTPDKSSKYLSQRSVMNHLRGIPPSPNWSNKYSTLILGNNLLYVSNLYIVNIDLRKREFSQLVYWSGISNKEKLNLICKLNEEKFLSVTNEGNFIIFQKYFNKNTEDTRAYFKESGQSFKFNSITHEIQIKTLKFCKSKDILICCDNKGSLYMIKILNLEREGVKTEMKFISSINMCKENIFITDLILLSDKITNSDFLIISDSSGALSSYYFLNNDNFVKLNQIGIDSKIECKHIFSIDSVYVPSIGSYLLSVLDKNGSLFLFLMTIEKVLINYVSNWKLIFLDKNKFNDRFYEEKYLYFSTRILLDQAKESFTVIVTSNQGKIFTLNLSFLDLEAINSENSKNYREVSENPHTMAIFSSELYKDKILFVSADRLISVFKLQEFIFEYDIKTQGTSANFLLKEGRNFKNLYAFNQDEIMYQYNYSKTINGLGIVSRNPLKTKMEKKKQKDPHRKILKIILVKQSEFNEFIFALIQEDINTQKISIAIYDFLSDVMLAKHPLESSVSSLIFHHCRTFDKEKYKKIMKREVIDDNDVMRDEPVINISINKKSEKLLSAIEQLFSNDTNYNLLYILDFNGMITVWDYILNRVNRFNIINFSNNSLVYSMLVPLNFEHDYLMSVMLNSRNEIRVYVFNQIISVELSNYNADFNSVSMDELYSPIETAVESNVVSVGDKLICDYFSDNNFIELIFVENSKDLKIFHFSREVFEFCKLDTSHSLNNFNEAVKKYSESLKENLSNKEGKIQSKFFVEINFKKITPGEIKTLKINRNSLTTGDNPSRISMNFAISQIDGIIKIYDLILEEATCNELQASLILNYTINSHIARITEICWLDNELLATSSVDNSVKLWNIKMCKLIDVKLAEIKIEMFSAESEKQNSEINKETEISYEGLRLVNNFNKVYSMCFYQQSYKSSNEFGNYFNEFYKNKLDKENIIDTNKIPQEYRTDFLLFFHSDFNKIEVNYEFGVNLLRAELKSYLEVGNIMKYVTNLINLFLFLKLVNLTTIYEEFLEKFKNKLLNSSENGNLQIKDNKNELICINIKTILEILENSHNFDFLQGFSSFIQIDYLKLIFFILNDQSHTNQSRISSIIKELIKNNLHIEAIVLYKLFKLYDINLYLSIIDKLSSFVYSKQIFQSQKCKKVIEILRNYFK